MDDFKRALFLGLSLANIPPTGWDCQVFESHKHHDGTVSQHQATIPSAGIAKMIFEVTDGTQVRSVTGTCKMADGHTTFLLDGVPVALPPMRIPQLDVGLEPGGSQIWFRYDDKGTLREYRLHTRTNLTFLANLLHLRGFASQAQVILNTIGV